MAVYFTACQLSQMIGSWAIGYTIAKRTVKWNPDPFRYSVHRSHMIKQCFGPCEDVSYMISMLVHKGLGSVGGSSYRVISRSQCWKKSPQDWRPVKLPLCLSHEPRPSLLSQGREAARQLITDAISRDRELSRHIYLALLHLSNATVWWSLWVGKAAATYWLCRCRCKSDEGRVR